MEEVVEKEEKRKTTTKRSLSKRSGDCCILSISPNAHVRKMRREERSTYNDFVKVDT
jgi:hypothetical protein